MFSSRALAIPSPRYRPRWNPRRQETERAQFRTMPPRTPSLVSLPGRQGLTSALLEQVGVRYGNAVGYADLESSAAVPVPHPRRADVRPRVDTPAALSDGHSHLRECVAAESGEVSI